MRAEITKEGQLIVIPEGGLEYYALNQWLLGNKEIASVSVDFSIDLNRDLSRPGAMVVVEE